MPTTKKTPVKKTSTRKATSGNRKNGSKAKSSDLAGKHPQRVNGASAKKKPARQATDRTQDSHRWTFFTNHAHVLICLYQDSQMILRDIASRVGITERAVQRIVQELEQAGFVERQRVGRRNQYKVIKNKNLRHPIEEHCSVDELFAVVLNK